MMKQTIFFLTAFLFLVSACSEDDSTPDPCVLDFDQEALFSNLADNQIIPAYTNFSMAFEGMQTAIESFLSNPTGTELATAQTAFAEAWLNWQAVAQYEFGPAEEVQLRSSINNFPVDTLEVLANIDGGAYDLTTPDTYDKGFPALDFLLYRGGDQATLDRFSVDPQAGAYAQYVQDVLADMKMRIDHTVDGWVSGTYRMSFVDNTGTAAGTSTSLVINSLNEHYETIKRDKLGIPSGVLTLGFTNPDKVEAYFSGLSLQLATRSLEAAQDYYLGTRADGSDGIGLDDYLREAGAEKNGTSLDDLIQAQFGTALSAIGTLQGALSEAVNQTPDEVETAYVETSRLVVLLKTDMPSTLCVAITYIDNPSDSD
jgi:predicted lipoprotein